MPEKPDWVISATSATQATATPPSASTVRSRARQASTSAAATPASSAGPSVWWARPSSSSHGWSSRDRLQLGSLRACAPAPNGCPEPIHSGISHSTGSTTAPARITRRVPGSARQAQAAYSARNGNTSGRIRQATTPSATAARREPSRWRSTAQSMAATASGASLPWAA